MRYGIGLDVGITSVGYAVLELDTQDMPCRIERIGAHVFEVAEHPKTGESLAKPRREARGMRRRIRRRRHRKERIRGLLVSNGVVTKEELQNLYVGKGLPDVYQLRAEALDRLLTKKELARVLIHLSQRRGFKSNRKCAEESDKESGQLLAAVNANLALCAEKHYRTVGEMLYKDEKFGEYKRNKGENYQNTVSRDAVEAEVKAVFAAQQSFGSAVATPELAEQYLAILLSQRSFAQGPGSGPYSGNQVERMRGFCTFEKGEPRAAKASYTFQVFTLWQRLNHLRIRHNGQIKDLSNTERHDLFLLAHQKEELTYAAIRKALHLEEADTFVGLNYRASDPAETEKKAKLRDLAPYHKMRKALNAIEKGYIDKLSPDQLDAIGEALSKNQSDAAITAELQKAGVPAPAIDELLKLPDFSKFGHLSVKACRNVIPFLETGLTYDKACEAAGYAFKDDRKAAASLLPPLPQDEESITSPVVRRAISRTIKVVNAIIREQGAAPVYINLELAREMSHNRKERDKIKKAQEENQELNERAMERLKERLREYQLTQNPSGQDLVKFKLWQQQDGVCPYSGQHIEIGRLLDQGYVEVDHIVPYSKCFDDRMANKVLVMTEENRQKGNRLPLEYMRQAQRDRFIVWVENQTSIPAAKKRRLLMEHLSDEAEWKQRNLTDTQFISTFLAKYIDQHLQFAPFANGRKRHVTCVNGAVTAYMRKRWGLTKVRENGDLHHAMDAAVIACVTQGMIHQITNFSKYKECRYMQNRYTVDEETGEVISQSPNFPQPWEGFVKELDIRLNSDPKIVRQMLNDWDPANYREVDLDTVPAAFVSRMCNQKVTGAAHEQTAFGARLREQGQKVYKKPLTKLKLKDGEIENYYNPKSDRLLYEALKARLQQFGGDAKAAFAEPFHKPRADGSQGPVVKSVKVADVTSSAVLIHGGTAMAANDNRVRCDVFFVPNDGYYFVPVYVSDTVKPQLPMKAPTQNKNNKWVEMREENFVFSLFKNSLIRVYGKGEIKLSATNQKTSLAPTKTVRGTEGVWLYFDGLDIGTGAFTGITHDNAYEKRGLGKTLPRIEKYEVDVLGNVRPVTLPEKRQRFHR